MMGHAYGHSLAERNKDCLRWNYQGQIDTCCMYRRLPARFAARWRDLVPFHPLGAEASDDVELPCSKGGLGWLAGSLRIYMFGRSLQPGDFSEQALTD